MRTQTILLFSLLCGLILFSGLNPTSLPAQTLSSSLPTPWGSLPGPTGGSVSHIVLAPDHQWNSPIFAAVRGHGLYRSLNGGDDWFPAGSGDWLTLDLRLSPAFSSDQTLFALTGSPWSGYVVRRSADSGHTWHSSDTFANAVALAISPAFATDQTLYLLTGNSNLIWRSTDGGVTFTPVSGWLGERTVNALAFSPAFATDRTLFAVAAGDGLYRSADGGATWSATPLTGTLRALALSPAFATDKMVLVIDGNGTVWRSHNAGASWASIAGLTLAAADHFSIAFSPTFGTDQVVMVAGSADPGPWRSLDGGHTWEAAGWYDPATPWQDGLIGGGVQALALVPNQAWDGLAFAATRTGIARSSHQGSGWMQSNRGLPTIAVRTLAEGVLTASFNTQILLAGSAFPEKPRFAASLVPDSGAIHRSTDGGQTWRQVSGRLARLNTIALSPTFSSDQTAFAAAGMVGQHGFSEGGLYRSTDGGQHWTPISPAPHAWSHLVISPHFATDRTLWAAGQEVNKGTALYRSTDGGNSWTLIAPGLNLTTLVVSPNHALDQTLFAGTGSAGVQRSRDGGLTWSQSLPGMQVTALAISPVYGAGRTLYATARPQAGAATTLYRSSDGGESWHAAGEGIPPWQGGQPLTITSLAWAADGSLLAGGQYGNNGAAAVWRSTNGGQSWQMLAAPGTDAPVYQFLSRSGHALAVWAATGGGLRTHLLHQGGPPPPASWQSSGPRGGAIHALALSPAFATDGVVFAGERRLDFQGSGNGSGVRKSADFGRTWRESSTGMTAWMYSNAVFSYAFSPAFASDRTLFVATWGGLFHSDNAGESWNRRPITYPAEIGFVLKTAVAPDFPTSGHMAAIAGYGNGQLWLSRDSGHTWHLAQIWPPGHAPAAEEALLQNDYIADVVYSPDYANDRTILISSLNGVWRSRDGGSTWSQVHGEYLPTLVFSPNYANDRTFWGGADFLHIFRDDGATWHSHPVGESDYVLSLAVSPAYAHDQSLFAGTDRGLYHSTNGGLDWEAIPEYANLTISRLALSPGWPAHPVLLVGTPQGVYRLLSADFSTGTLRQASEGLAVLETTTLALAPDHSLLLAGTYQHGIFSSRNRGAAWQISGSPWGGGFYATLALAISPADATGQTLFAVTASSQSMGASIYRSQDGGENWVDVYHAGYITDLAVSPGWAADGVIFSAAEGYLRYSTDRGDRWQTVGSWNPAERGHIIRITLPPGYPTDRRLLVGSTNGFWFSPDNAGHWSQATSGLVTGRTVNRVAVSPAFGSDATLLAVASWSDPAPSYTQHHAIFRSTNGGVDWAPVMAGIPTTETVRDLAFSPRFATDQTVWAITERALYRSRDGGAGWAFAGVPPVAATLHHLQAEDATSVHIGTSAGVWHYHSFYADLIINGGFEGAGGWTLPATPITARYSQQVVYNGRTALQIGLDNAGNQHGYSSVRQPFTLPVQALQATLTFHLYPVSGEATLATQTALLPEGRWQEAVPESAGDAQYVLLLDALSADILQILHWDLSNAQAWQRHTVSLPPEYAGRPLLLHFGVFNDGLNGRSALYVDDVSLTILDGTLAPWRVMLPVVYR